ncbi:MAG TPA: glycosyltransferase [Gemmatimonadales bacterium]
MTPGVLHVASSREWRGGQRQVWLLARELARLGLSQRVLTGAGSELARRLEASGVPVRAVRWRAGLDPRVLPALRAEARSGPSLIHAHDAHALALAALASWGRSIPLVVTRRVDFPLRRPGLWRRAERVIAISAAVARVLRTDGIDPGRIVIVRSGVDLEAAEAAAPIGLRARLGIPADAILAAHLGALVPHKDQATLLRAAALLRERCPTLYWVVAGEGELRPELRSLLEELGLGDRVHLVGQVSEPLGLLAEADLFVMSSRQEGLGTAVLDAMARGIPVASTDAGGLPEMLAGGAGVLVPAGNPSALADAVERLAGSPALRQEIGARARAAARRFSARRMAEEVLTVYRSCATLN